MRKFFVFHTMIFTFVETIIFLTFLIIFSTFSSKLIYFDQILCKNCLFNCFEIYLLLKNTIFHTSQKHSIFKFRTMWPLESVFDSYIWWIYSEFVIFNSFLLKVPPSPSTTKSPRQSSRPIHQRDVLHIILVHTHYWFDQ